MARKHKARNSKGARAPHEVDSLLEGLHYVVSSMLDSRTAFVPIEDVYAVFEARSALCAFAGLYIGFSKIASISLLRAEEGKRRIYIYLTGKRRLPREALTYRDILPETESHERILDALLSQNRMAYALDETDGELCLSVSLPRFLVDETVVGVIEKKDVRDCFYDMMLLFSGETPKHPLQ